MSVEPADDAGARTADLFEWQAAMGAADGLRLYLDALGDDQKLPESGDGRIVCEHHEDWVLVRGEAAELVSAKHKEPSFGAYTTVHQLLDAGGIAHLFQRWHKMDEKPLCRLVTTAGLKAGPAQEFAAAAKQLCTQRLAQQPLTLAGDLAGVVPAVGNALMAFPRMLPDQWSSGDQSGAGSADLTSVRHDQIRRFLSVLTLQCENPSRLHVGYAAPGMFVAPVLKRLDRPEETARAVWEAVLTLFRTRMRAAGLRPEGALPRVLAYPLGAAQPGPAEAERDLASRIVTLSDIDLAIRTALASPAGFMPLTPLVRTSRLAVKMDAGRCLDNSVERAEHLLVDYRNYWRARSSGDPTARAHRQRLTRTLLKIADAASTVTVDPLQPWGQAFWNELQTQFGLLDPGTLSPGMDADLMLGGICDLVSRCKVWFSPAFDVDARIAELRASLEEAG